MKRKLVILLVLVVLGASLLALMQRKPFVDRSKCVGCADCTRICPTQAIGIEAGRARIDDTLCIDCKLCVKTCTYRAIRTPR